MSMQVKGKFIRLEAGEALTQKKQNGEVVEVIKAVEESGQVKVKANGQEIAIKSDVDGHFISVEASIDLIESQLTTLSNSLTSVETSLSADIASETSARETADNLLDARLDVIEGADTVEGSVAKAEKDAKDYADAAVLVEKTRAEAAEATLSTAIANEASDRVAGDAATLSSANSYTDSQVAALVNSAPAVLDTLKELADAINGDASFASTVAGQVGAVQANLDAEETRALAAEASLAADIASLTSASTAAVAAEEARALAAEAALQAQITTLDSDLAAAEAALSAAITAEQTARIADVNAEETRALAAEAALQTDIDAEEARAVAAEALKVNKAGDTMDVGASLQFNDAQTIPGYTKVESGVITFSNVGDPLEKQNGTYTGYSFNLSAESQGSDSKGYANFDAQQGRLDIGLTNYADSYQHNFQLAPEGILIASGASISLAGPVSLYQFEAADPLSSSIAFVPTSPAHATTKAYVDAQVGELAAVVHHKEKFVLSAADLAAGYIELSELAKAKSTVASVGRLMIHEADEVSGQALTAYADDYYISEVAGKTRLVFVGNLVAPSDEQLAVGDVIYVKYMA